jgi:hypothetical protein
MRAKPRCGSRDDRRGDRAWLAGRAEFPDTRAIRQIEG